MSGRVLLCGAALVVAIAAAPAVAGACAQSDAEWRGDVWAANYMEDAPGAPAVRGAHEARSAAIHAPHRDASRWRSSDPHDPAEPERSVLDWARDFGKLLILLSVPMAFVALQVTLHRQLPRRPPTA